MKSNDSLENLFKEFNPTMSGEQTFMNKLNRKLEAVEYIKQMQEHQAQRQRYTMFVAVVLCTIICTIVITLMQSESKGAIYNNTLLVCKWCHNSNHQHLVRVRPVARYQTLKQ